MLITQITILKGGGTTIFPTYNLMLEAKRAYWEATRSDKFQQFEKHHELIHESERCLEMLYSFEPEKLKGAHLIFGSIVKMRKAFRDDHLRDIIRNDQAEFSVKIGAETRFVTSRLTDHTDNSTRLYATYQIRHNFYGIAIMEDPIAIP